jgi:hypothetical protein
VPRAEFSLTALAYDLRRVLNLVVVAKLMAAGGGLLIVMDQSRRTRFA